jgi:putative ABC transport system permease protein
LTLRFVLSWQAILLSIAVAFATVLLSAWLPARKAAKTPAIDAIRGAGEVKVAAKQVRHSWLVGKLFGFEGTLASKSLKRSSRNFRATVISLTVSIVLLIIVGDFGALLGRATTMFFPGINANVATQFYTSDHRTLGDDGTILERRNTTVNSGLANDIAVKMREFENTALFGVGVDNNTFRAPVPPEMFTPRHLELYGLAGHDITLPINLSVALVAIDADNYAKLCETAGLPFGSNILVNQVTWYHEAGGREVFTPFVFTNQTLPMKNYYDGTSLDIPLHGQITETDIPGEVGSISGGLTVIVPQIDALAYHWYANAADPDGFEEYAFALIEEMLVFDESLGRVSVMNIEASLRATQAVGNLILTFVYGFVAMLTLIGLTNVISTISTNIRSRSREFAILRSVGITEGGLKRMLNLESVLCSMKSLMYGLPLGVLGSYLVYTALEMPVDMSYKLPWVPIIQCTAGVFIISWVVMRYAASRLRGGSIVEVIRNEAV